MLPIAKHGREHVINMHVAWAKWYEEKILRKSQYKSDELKGVGTLI